MNVYSRHDLHFCCLRASRRVQEGGPGMDPASQELQPRRAGVPLSNIYRDVGVSGATGIQGHPRWHEPDGRLPALTSGGNRSGQPYGGT